MKKIYTLLMACAIATVAMAQINIDIPKATNANLPILDGDVDAVWDNALVEVNSVEMQTASGDTVATFNSNEFRLLCGDTALYVLIEVDDDEFAPPLVTELSDWQSDRNEFFIDVNVADLDDGRGADPNVPGQGPWSGHYQFTTAFPTLAVGGTGDDTIAIGLQAWPKNVRMDIAYVVDGDQWTYEIVIPYTSLNIDSVAGEETDAFDAQLGVIVGLEMAAADVDVAPLGYDIRKFVRWGGIDAWPSMDGCNTGTIGPILSDISETESSTGINVYNTLDQLVISNFEGTIQVYDMVGKMVKEVYTTGTVNISDLTNGIYVLKANEITVKFVK